MLIAGCASAITGYGILGDRREPTRGRAHLLGLGAEPGQGGRHLEQRQQPEHHGHRQEAGGGDTCVTKMLTAYKAGSGAPDLIQAEYQAIPTLVSNDALADIAGRVAGDEGASSPTASGAGDARRRRGLRDPAGHRADDVLLPRGPLQAVGLTVPTTWDEFAETARGAARSRSAEVVPRPRSPPTTPAGSPASPSRRGQVVDDRRRRGSRHRRRARPRRSPSSGAAWSRRASSTTSRCTPRPGTRRSTPASRSAGSAPSGRPGVLTGNAADTKGKWKMAPLPQWDAARRHRQLGRLLHRRHHGLQARRRRREVRHLAEHRPRGRQARWSRRRGIYPAATTAQRQSALTEPPAFFSNQPDFYTTAAEIAEDAAVPWGPNVNVAYTTFKDAFGKAARRRRSRLPGRPRPACSRTPSPT